MEGQIITKIRKIEYKRILEVEIKKENLEKKNIGAMEIDCQHRKFAAMTAHFHSHFHFSVCVYIYNFKENMKHPHLLL